MHFRCHQSQYGALEVLRKDVVFHGHVPLFAERKALVTSKGPRNDSTMEDEEMVIAFF